MDYYSILGVNEESSDKDIKKAFRKLSMKHHPDRGGQKDVFQKINEAYEVLKDQQKKQEYDLSRGGNPLSQLFGGMGGPPNEGIGQMFNMMFGGRIPGGVNNPNVQIFHNGVRMNSHISQKPPPIVKTIEISLEQSYTGLNVPIEIERWFDSDGTRRVEKEKIYIEIPKGVDSNEIIMIRGKGNIKNENLKGDIKLFINIKNTTDFIRDGLDLLIQKKISLKESLIGFEFDIKHIAGKSFKINNIDGNVIKPFFKKKIPELGMIRGDKKGSLIISFEVEFPDSLSQSQKEQIKNILLINIKFFLLYIYEILFVETSLVIT